MESWGARRWTVMAACALAGLADALYLSWSYYDPAVRVCIVAAGCETVNTSAYAAIGGVPVAFVGTAGYVLIVAALLARRWGPPAARPAAAYAAYGLAAAGTAFSLYLTAVEAFVLHAYCTWCLFSAAMVTAVCVTATIDLAARGRA